MNESKHLNEEFAEVDRATATLSQDIRPDRDLWPEIAERIDPPPRIKGMPLQWLRSPILSAASLLIAASALTFALTRGGDPAMPVTASQALPSQTVYALDAGFAADRERLGRRIQANINQLPPEMQGLVRQNLASIRGSAEQINLALASDPTNTDLQELLVATYQQELQVMTELAKMPEMQTRRIDL